jgi:hypothetical protein
MLSHFHLDLEEVVFVKQALWQQRVGDYELVVGCSFGDASQTVDRAGALLSSTCPECAETLRIEWVEWMGQRQSVESRLLQ